MQCEVCLMQTKLKLNSTIDGTLPPYLTVKRLCSPNAVPARWNRQSA
jgi:hypothetical protein